MSKVEKIEVIDESEVSIGTLFENGPTIGILDIPIPEVDIGTLEIPVEGEVVE